MPYCLLAPGCSKNDFTNLGSLYCAVAQALGSRDDWAIKTSKQVSGRFHLLLGEAQASTIPYKLLSGYDSLYPGLCPVVNFYRGFNILCRKTMMVKTLRHFLESRPDLPPFEALCPQSFLFYPSKVVDSEREVFLSASERCPNTVWILKPSDGCKGHSIMIMDSVEKVLTFIDQQTEGSIAWVIQTYLERPILIPRGRRKFDIRVWVLLDEDYSIHVYGQGALRVTAKTYRPGEWDDIHCHLSNHCIAETHPDYGQYEPTNEIWYNEFEEILLGMTQQRVSFHRDIIPRIHNIVVLSLLAVKETLRASSCTAYK
jgi:tubulin---tyrosine ligase